MLSARERFTLVDHVIRRLHQLRLVGGTSTGGGGVGPAGPKGDKGDPGDPGLDGLDGTNGVDAYYARRRMTADQTIGVAATTLVWNGGTVALLANSRYKYRATLIFRCGTNTATWATRVIYSGTLVTTGANAAESIFRAVGFNGVPGAFAAAQLVKQVTAAVNAAIAAVANGFGNHGNTTSFGIVEVTGTIYTVNAGNLDLSAIASIANGLVLEAGSTLDVETVPA